MAQLDLKTAAIIARHMQKVATTDPVMLRDMLRNAKGAVAEPVIKEHVRTMMNHREQLQRTKSLLQRAKEPGVSPETQARVAEHAKALLAKHSALSRAMQSHANVDAYKAHKAMTAQGPMGAHLPMRDPRASAAHQHMTHNPQQYTASGPVSSGLELDMSPRRFKQGSEMDKLANALLRQGANQIKTLVNNPGQIGRGAEKLYNAAGGGLAGAGRVAKHYAPGIGMVGGTLALGALANEALSDKRAQVSEVQKLANMMKVVGKGVGLAGKAVGALPTGVGNVIGGAMGAVGGAMAAPPGKRMAGAAAGSLSGLPGGAGFVAPMVAGRAMGV